MIVKEVRVKTMNYLRILPNQVIDHPIFAEKIQKGLSDSINGNINSKEEVKQKLGKWLK
jgi:hypothetical protein